MDWDQPPVQNITFISVTAPVSGGASTVVDYIQELMSESVASFKTCFTIKHIYYSKSYRIPCPFKIKKTISAFFEARKLLSSRPQSFEMVCIRNIAMKSFEAIRNSRGHISPIAPIKQIIGDSKNDDLPGNHRCVLERNAARHGITPQMVEKEKSHESKRNRAGSLQ